LIFPNFIMYRYWPVVVGSAVVVKVGGETTTTNCNVRLTFSLLHRDPSRSSAPFLVSSVSKNKVKMFVYCDQIFYIISNSDQNKSFLSNAVSNYVDRLQFKIFKLDNAGENADRLPINSCTENIHKNINNTDNMSCSFMNFTYTVTATYLQCVYIIYYASYDLLCIDNIMRRKHKYAKKRTNTFNQTLSHWIQITQFGNCN